MCLDKEGDDRLQSVAEMVVESAQGHDVCVGVGALSGGFAGAGVKMALVEFPQFIQVCMECFIQLLLDRTAEVSYIFMYSLFLAVRR